jgi:hypothetical protein
LKDIVRHHTEKAISDEEFDRAARVAGMKEPPQYLHLHRKSLKPETYRAILEAHAAAFDPNTTPEAKAKKAQAVIDGEDEDTNARAAIRAASEARIHELLREKAIEAAQRYLPKAEQPPVRLNAADRRVAHAMGVSEDALLANKTRLVEKRRAETAREAKRAAASGTPALTAEERRIAKAMGTDIDSLIINKANRIAAKKGK